jgi:hypothetical protein
MIRCERERPAVDVVDDQHGQPTWTADVARAVIALARSGAPAGVYHATSSGSVTWYGFAREIFGLLGADPARVRPVTTAEFPRPAPRPAYTRVPQLIGFWAASGDEWAGQRLTGCSESREGLDTRLNAIWLLEAGFKR